ICFIARAYGREAFIRSCALRIFEAETISSARVTLRVFCTLLILVLISLPPAMSSLALLASGFWSGDPATGVRRPRCPLPSPGAGRLEVFDALAERGFDLVVPAAAGVDLRDQVAGGVVEV